MALGQQQSRPVTPFEFTVTTITGIVDAIENFDDTLIGGTLVDNTYTGVAVTGGSGTGLTLDVVVTGGVIDTVTINSGGTGYVLTDSGLTIAGSDLDDNGVTGTGSGTSTFDVASLVGEVATTTITNGGTGYITGDIISDTELSSDGFGTGVAGTVTATGGVVSAFTITSGGNDYVGGDTETVTYSGSGEIGISDSRYINHDQYELGGATNEYSPQPSTLNGENTQYKPLTDAETLNTGTFVGDPSKNPDNTSQRFDDNISTVRTVTKPDLSQWSVQQRDIDGGVVTVFAEPNIVDANGNRVGHTIRAEDIVDESRCTSLGFTWTTSATGDGDTGSYGYCTETVTFSETLDKTVCITNGYVYDNELDVCVNSDGTDVAVLESYLNGGAGDLYSDNQKKVICNQHGYFWDGSSCVLTDSVDFTTTYTTQDTCSSANGVWVAGTCYSPFDFGNGQGGNYSETVGSHNN